MRRMTFLASAAFLLAAVLLAPGGPAESLASSNTAKARLIEVMELELQRSMDSFGRQDPPAYFIQYSITEQHRAEVTGSNAALLSSQENRSRWFEARLRVGSYEFDSTRKVGERDPGLFQSPGVQIPIEDDAGVIRRAIWLETDRQYRSAANAFLKIQTAREVKVEGASSEAPDFSREQPHQSYLPTPDFQVDRAPWEEKVRRYTAAFRASPAILNCIVTFSAQATSQYLVNSEGTRLQFGSVNYRLELFTQSKAPDGMDINRYYNFDWVDPKNAPSDEAVLARVREMIREAESLVAAPLVEPYAGPAMLTGRAAAVFFHEVFGHRVEGHRQKDITEGQTFTGKVGEQVMPEFISVYDDPTRERLDDTVLLGYYPYDDEGVPAQRVALVEDGVLKNFLLSRSPLPGFTHSNGHGRRQLGYAPISRQGNLIVESGRAVSPAELRRMFLEEIRRQGKPFGLLIDDIAGGFTFTGRGLPQAFQVIPLIVYRVYADGRPDELVRGVDIVGTPLVSLTKIVATDNRPEIFNGYCGAESGSVPVAAVSPALLISEMEVQKKETSSDKPPILPPPHHDPLANGGWR